ncbi:MAG: flavin-containing monooxygenase [Pseudomonadales bacterium]
MNTNRDSQGFDAIVIGAGFAGLYMLHRLRAVGLSVCGIEAGDDVGGTWYWNRYPGARCDVDSLDYQFAFSDELQRGWTWTERYATQPEIQRYLSYVADHLDLRQLIHFRNRVTSAAFDEADSNWRVETDANRAFTARYCIAAVGCLSAAQVPDIPGLGDFSGAWYHTGQWPEAPVDFADCRVGVIGTGSSGIQAIPIIAQEAADLVVFQRSPSFSVPARNAALPNDVVEAYKDEFLSQRAAACQTDFGNSTWQSLPSALEEDSAARVAEYERRWQIGGAGFMVTYADLMVDKAANDTAADFLRDKIAAIVEDQEVARRLMPFDYPIGAKRLCVDTDYYATFNRANVRLVDLRDEPIEAITPNGIRTQAADYAVDCLVFATGFDAMTGPLTRIDLRGRDGLSLAEQWQESPQCYLGVAIAGFPNLFTITGPGSPSVLSNMVLSIEQHVEWIADCITHLQACGATTIEAQPDAQADWAVQVDEVAATTLFPQGNSWYIGANVPGKPRVFMPYTGGVRAFREICDAVVANEYAGFTFS